MSYAERQTRRVEWRAMAPPAHLDACLNCGTDLTGPYCSQCGQRNTAPRLAARDVAADLAQHFLQFDSALGRTLIGLTRNPGKVAREYVFGMRKRYVNPFKYCFTITALFFVWNAWIGFDLTSTMPMPELPADAPEHAQALARFGPAMIATVKTHLNNVVFLALPLFALALRGLFRRAGFNFAENYAFLLFVTGHTYLIGMAFSILGLAVPGLSFAVRVVFRFAFFAYGAVVFYDTPKVTGTLKALAAMLVYMAIVGAVTASLTLAFLMLGSGSQ